MMYIKKTILLLLFVQFFGICIAQDIKIIPRQKALLNINQVALNNAGGLLAVTFHYQNDVSVFENITGKELVRLAFDDVIRNVYFTADDKNLVVVFNNKIEVVALSGQKLAKAALPRFIFTSADYNAKTSTLAVVYADSVFTYRIAANAIVPQQSFVVNKGSISRFSPNGKFIFCKEGQDITVHDATTGILKNTFTVNNLTTFTASDSALIVLTDKPSSCQYYHFDGTPAGEKNAIKKAFPFYPPSIQTMGNFYVLQAYDKLLNSDRYGNEIVIKTGDVYNDVRIDYTAPGYVLISPKKIRTVNDDGNPLNEITPENYLHMDMIYMAGSEKNILITDTLLQFSNDGKNMRKFSLPSKYAGLNKVVNGILVFACVDGTILVWDIDKEKQLYQVKHTSIPYDIAFDTASKQLYLSDFLEHTIYRYNLETKGKTIVAKTVTPVTALCLSGTKLYYGQRNGSFSMAMVSGGDSRITTTKIFGNAVTAIQSFENDVLITSFGRAILFKKDLSDSTTSKRLFVGHNGYITTVSAQPKSNYFVTASADNTIKLWDLKNQYVLKSYNLDSVYANRLQTESDSMIIFYGPGCVMGIVSDSVTIKLAKNPRLEVVVQSPNNNAPVKLVINKQGNLLASTDDKTVKVRDLKTGFMISEFSTEAKNVNGICFTPDGKMLVVATGAGIECFEPLTGNPVRNINLENSNRSIHDVEAIDNVITALNIHGWHSPLFYHKNSGLYIGQFSYNLNRDEYDKNLYDIKFSSDGKWAATFGNNYVKVFERIGVQLNWTQKFAIKLKTPGKAYDSVDILDFSEDGKYLMYVEFTDDSHTALQIISTADGKQVKTQNGGQGKFGKGGNYVFALGSKLVLSNVADDSWDLLPASFDIGIKSITYNAVADIYAAADAFGNIRLIEGKYGITTTSVNRWDQYTYTTTMSANNKYMLFNNRWGLYLLNMQTLNREQLPADNYPFKADFSPVEDKVFFLKSNTIFAKNPGTSVVDTLVEVPYKSDEIKGIKLSADGKIVMLYHDDNGIAFYNIASRKLLWDIDKSKVQDYINLFIYDLEGTDGAYKLFAAGFKANADKTQISLTPLYLDLPSLKTIKTLALPLTYNIKDSTGFAPVVFERDSKVNHFSPGKTYHAYMKNLKLYLTVKGLEKPFFTRDNPILSGIAYVQFDKAETRMLLGFDDGTVEVYDLTQKGDQFTYGEDVKGLKRLHVLKTNDNGIQKMELINNMLLVKGRNEMVTLFDAKNNYTKILDMVFMKNRDQIFLEKDGYYYTTKNASKYLAFKEGTDILPFESYDYTYNRPDKVMEALQKQSLVSDEMVTAYKNAYQKRIAKVQPQAFNAALPTIKVNDTQLKPVQYQRNITLPVTAQSVTGELSALQITVNGVPYFGSKGKSVSGKLWKGDIVLPLSSGPNTIKVTVSNSQNVESYPQTLYINYASAEKTKPNLYFIAVSVSDYESDNDLKYPQKDGRDMCAVFSDKQRYANIYVDTLFNNQATREKFTALKQKLMNAGPDDHVIVFFSGHGLLDKNYDFYFATYDCDFKNPAGRGLSYTTIESLLDSVPARKKILFLDACHSGEFDKDSKQQYNKLASNVKSTFKETGKGGKITNTGLGLENSYILMQDVFSDLSKGSGTVVISAAAGDSYALESDKWNNGVFTYSIISGIRDGDADLDNNKKVTASELRDYVYKRVSEETGGRQKPTTRQENLDFDWEIW